MEILYSTKSIKKINAWANLKEEAARKLIRRAFVNGKTVDELPSKEAAYINGELARIGRDNITAYIYAGMGFVFSWDNCCINMIKIPSWFGKKSYYQDKMEIKHPKRYNKFNNDNLLDDFEYMQVA